GVLAKGPVAVLLPAVVFFLYLASQRRLGDLRQLMLPVGAAIGLAIVLPWYFVVYREHGGEYITRFAFEEHLGRSTATRGELSRRCAGKRLRALWSLRRRSRSFPGASCCARCPTSSATNRCGRFPPSSGRAPAWARSSATTSSRCPAWCST